MCKNIKGVRVGSSNHEERMKELRDNHLRLQEMINNGWEIKAVKVRRPRIHKELAPKRIKVQAGFITITVEYADWKANGSVGKIVEKYY